MNASKTYKNKKNSAQAMMEFTMALPVLLLLLYGVLETGRLLFIYASTITAARQAVRYGSATGTTDDGITHYYQDCEGITAAADNMGFINAFDAISISYDGGFNSDGTVNHLGDTTPTSNSDGSPDVTPDDPDCGEYAEPTNGDRVVVEVTAQWEPIVPLVPLNALTIKSQSERTIFASVPISVDGEAGGFVDPNQGYLTLDISASSPTFLAVGQIITYTYRLENTGLGSLTSPFTVIDDHVVTITCSSPPVILAPAAAFTCTGAYQITAADMTAGKVINIASATASSSNQAVDTETITLASSPALSLSKSAFPKSASSVGANITYTYTLTNTGNVNLTSPFSVVDDKIAVVNCSAATSPLAPGASTTCTATYKITSSDIAAQFVTNHATASATFTSSTITSNSALATVSTAPLILDLSASPTTITLPNQVIAYTYSVTNHSSDTVRTVSITDNMVTVNCPSSIEEGHTAHCSGSYAVPQTKYDSGGSINNSAVASANNGTLLSNTDSTSVVITQIPALSAVVSASPSQPTPPATALALNTLITYTYVLTNTGNVTLSPPFLVNDNKAMITCVDQSSMAPGGTKTCTGTHAVTNDDIYAGSIINTGTASALFGAQIVGSLPVSATVATYSGARFKLDLAATPTTITLSGTSITFTYTITNTGGKPLTSPYSITSSLLGTFNCAGTSPLAPGTSTFCQNSYTPSETVTNTITAATAFYGSTSVPSSSLPSLTVPSYICNPTNLILNAPTYNGNTVTWRITNNVGTHLHISSISVSWETSGNRYLNSVELPAGTLPTWSGSDEDGFAIFSGSWGLNLNDTTLKMTFSKTNISVTDMNLTISETGCGPLNNP